MAATELVLGTTNTKAKRSWKALLLRVTLAFGLSIVLLEASLHFLLFSENPTIVKATKEIRDPDLWSNYRYDSTYWKLSHLWNRNVQREGVPANADPILGWRPNTIREDYSVVTAAPPVNRRPVVLYGDSFARGVTEWKESYEALFMSSETGDDYALFNHGVGGYGLGQSYLMMLNSVDMYVDHNPVVIFSFLVPDDLYRIGADFRGWAKPYFTAEDGKLVLHELETNDPSVFFEKHPLSVGSLTWRGLLHGTKLLPEAWVHKLLGQERAEAQIEVVTELLLSEAKAKLDSLGVDWFVLLFQSESDTRALTVPNREEEFVRRTLDKLGMPYVATRSDLWQYAKRNQASLSTLFVQPPAYGSGHFSGAGNRATMATIERGIHGDFETEFLPGPRPGDNKKAAQ